MTAKDILLAWLNDAHAMENGIIEVLEKQASASKDFPDVQSRIQQHLTATRRHADLVKGCVQRLGGDVSSTKSGLASMLGWFQGLLGGTPDDALVKNAIADYAVEHFEIATYNAIITAAEELGDQETITACREILRDEEEMARWLSQNLPLVTREVLNKLAATTS